MRKTLVLFLLVFIYSSSFSQLQYPTTKKIEHVDEYSGVKVPDPYRWLEDDNSDETKAWVAEQNKVTNGYLTSILYRDQMKKRIEEVYNYPKLSAPFKNNDYFYYYKNDGLQNQSVLYRKKGLDGKEELIMDPNKLAADGTTRLAGFILSKDGKYAAWGISKGGSDWQNYFVRDMTTMKDLPDTLDWVKVSGIAWQGNGFYYSRYPAPEKGAELSGKNENHQVWYHKAGTAQSQDELIFEDKANPQRFHQLVVSDDERFSFLYVADRGKGFDGNALLYRDSKTGDKTFKPIVQEVGKYSYGILDNIGDKLLLVTNDDAPNMKIIQFDPASPAKSSWKTVLPEKPEPLGDVSTAGGKLIVSYLKDVTTRVYVHTLEGKFLNEVKLPGLGTSSGFSGKKEDKFTFYTFASFTTPPTIYRYDIATGTSTIFNKPNVAFNPSEYETKQVFYPSKDGTKIPMFIVHKKGVKLDGNNPTLLYAYGGFNVSETPYFNATLVPWLEQGGVYAMANLRGGSEYGEKWHEAGMRFKKQNVFDDFIAAGEYLIKEKYTSSQKLAIRGGSNGGLLVGAVINQRPDLFKVAIPQVGVMDMLRFHKFTIGWNWIAEYGSSDSTADFKNLYAYSPLHNLKSGLNYPATLVTTADHDDRVVPAHSFKYAATLQEKYKGNNPVLIRIDTNSGHGSSNTAKSIELISDIYCFIFNNMGVKPVFSNSSSTPAKKAF